MDAETMTTMTLPRLDLLPTEIQKKILISVGNAPDLLNCERTCRSFRWILKDDGGVWKSICIQMGKKIIDDRLSFREFFFVRSTLQKIRKEQKNPENIILGVLSPAAFRAFVVRLGAAWGSNSALLLRGDSLALMVEILQEYFVKRLQQAMSIAVRVAEETDSYPTVTAKELRLLKVIDGSNGIPILDSEMMRSLGIPFVQPPPPQLLEMMILPHVRMKLVRRFAYRAGVVKMSNEAFRELERDFCFLSSLLLRRALLEYNAYPDNSGIRFLWMNNGDTRSDENVLPPNEMMYNYMPPGECCLDCGNIHERIIVPRQIEEEARDLRIVRGKVYGRTWVSCAPDPSSEDIEKEKAAALAQYYWHDPADMSKEESSSYDAFSQTGMDHGSAPSDYSESVDMEEDDIVYAQDAPAHEGTADGNTEMRESTVSDSSELDDMIDVELEELTEVVVEVNNQVWRYLSFDE